MPLKGTLGIVKLIKNWVHLLEVRVDNLNFWKVGFGLIGGVFHLSQIQLFFYTFLLIATFD